MRVIIAGGRDYELSETEISHLNVLLVTLPIKEVVSGGARGVDTCGEAWARRFGLPVKRFPADWTRHRRSAGPIRNGEMAAYADALVAFPGGRGTADMVKQATAKGLKVFDWRKLT